MSIFFTHVSNNTWPCVVLQNYILQILMLSIEINQNFLELENKIFLDIIHWFGTYNALYFPAAYF